MARRMKLADDECVLTLRCRVKDKHARFLLGQAAEVNLVWNYDNETSHRHTQRTGGFLSSVDLDALTAGATVGADGLSLHSQTVQAVNKEYCDKRIQAKKSKLRWRKSHGANRSLGWIPFKKSAISYKNGQIHYQGKPISLWDSYGLSKYDLGPGEFSEDARGRWYINLVVKVKKVETHGTAAVGVDLGLKEAAVCSDGTRLVGRRYRELEAKLGLAQRAGKKDRARALHAKIANRRRDDLHKLSNELIEKNAAIFVGDVSSTKLVKTILAKSVYDAGWGLLKNMLEYKSRRAGVFFEVVSESFSTQTCSCCGGIPPNSPKGRTGLRMREWSCSACGAVHDRDVNAARNILAAGHCRLAGGNPGSS